MKPSDLSSIGSAMEPLRAIQKALEQSGLGQIDRAFAKQGRFLDGLRLPGDTLHQRMVEDIERWRKLTTIASPLLGELTGMGSLLESIKRAALPAHTLALVLQSQTSEFNSSLEQVRKALSPNYESWTKLFLDQGGTQTVRAAIVAASLANTHERRFAVEQIDAQLEAIDSFIVAATEQAGSEKTWPKWARDHWQFWFTLLLTIAIFIYQELDDTAEAKVASKIETAQAQTDARFDRVENLLDRLLEVPHSKYSGQQYVVLGEQVRVRARPEGFIVGVAGQNQEVTALDKTGRWIKISYYDHVDERVIEGWVRKDYLRNISHDDEQIAATAAAR